MRLCEQDGCDRKHYAKGMCRVCYYRQPRRVEYMRRYRQAHNPPRLFAPSLADQVDEGVVLRLIDGDKPDHLITSWERREAVRRLVTAGVPKKQVARRLGIHERQVYRDLRALGLIAVPSVSTKEATG